MIRSRPVHFLYLASLSLGTPLILIHSFLWSEPFFLFLLGIKILLLLSALDTGKFRVIFLLGIAGFLLCLQRNAGVFFVGGITISLLFLGKDRYKKLYSLYYLLVSLSGFSLWNYYAAQTEGRDFIDHPFFSGYLGNNTHYINVMGDWFVFLPDQVAYPAVLLIALALTCGLLLFRTFQGVSTRVLRYFKAIFIILALYLSAMFVLTGYYPFESERLLAVLYPVAMLLVFFTLDRAAQIPLVKKYYRVILIATCVWLLYPAVRTIKNTHHWHKESCQKSESSARGVNSYSVGSAVFRTCMTDSNSNGHIFLSPQKK